ncbi:MAG: hypothetical protein KF794_10745 [Xanthobacteraceae bacterium]|nr:hypothetical protein [Xanthobacteraceae bacterium]QYK44260.1 MAG: hypothetical protein KF794_10745 [Xanthobacteraceae bacterium]
MKPRRLSLALAAFALTLAAAAPAHAFSPGSSVGYENGGKFVRFDPVVQEYNRTGAPFRIVGLCQSACTLFLSIRNVCVEPNASFGFHSANDGNGNKSEWGNRHLLSHYNPKLRRFVEDNGYLNTFDFHYISGRVIIEKFGYPACKTRYLDRTDNDDRSRDDFRARGNSGSTASAPSRPDRYVDRGSGNTLRRAY